MYRIATSLIALLVWLSVPAAVSAHTGVAVSTPSNGAIVDEDLTQIEITFTTTYERESSSATLTNEAGIELPPAELLHANKTMSLRFDEPLPSGSYTVNWKLVGEDGHAVEGQYGFTVQLSASEPHEAPAAEAPEAVEPSDGDESGAAGEEPAEQPDQSDAEDAGEAAVDGSEDAAQADDTAPAAASSSKLGTGGMIAIVAGIAVLALLVVRNLRKQS